jgi:hypothetical protein
MKHLVILIIVPLAGLVAYNYFTTGEIKLMPSAALSDDEKKVKSLEEDFLEAQSKFFEGSRAAAVGGIDTPADVAGAMREMERIEGKVRSLIARLSSGTAKEKAERLLSQIETFKKAHQ